MKISYRWLREWVKIDITPDDLAEKLTMCGLEVEDIQQIEQNGVQDTILDLGITANRGDCLGMLGIAREVSRLVNKEINIPQISFKESGIPVSQDIDIQIEDTKNCLRYTGRIIKNIKPGKSPLWLKQRLEAIGLRSINNIVDVTNYVLWEWGQPLHAFDLDKLEGNKIIVRGCQSGEDIKTLDGISRTLKADTLVIADKVKPVAIAGIMGGANSEVNPDTRNVLLECAYFNPSKVRISARQMALSTDSSYRFERGVDISQLPNALNRAAQLICEIAGGEISQSMIDEYPNLQNEVEVSVRFERVNKILGTSLTAASIIQIIKGLQFVILDNGNRGLKLRIPAYRNDIKREIDIIEEIARCYGYANITADTPSGCASNNPVNTLPKTEDMVRNILTSCGFWEAINFSFTNQKYYCKLNTNKNRGLKLKNPLSQDQQLLRNSLIPGLLENINTNLSYQQEDVSLFEIGTVYEPAGMDKLPQEKRLIAGVVSGKTGFPFWNEPAVKSDFYHIKGVVETLLAGFGIEDALFAPAEISFLETGAKISIGQDDLGFLGKLKRDTADDLDLAQTVYLFEIDLLSILAHAPSQKKFKPLCRFPAITRDMALVVAEDISAQDIKNTIWSVHQPHLKQVGVFDVYRGSKVDDGCKSIALSLHYQSYEKTLTEEEINNDWQKLLDELKHKLGANLRR